MQDSILCSDLQGFPVDDRPLPPRAGAGLKPAHVADILANRPAIGFFEVHAENYMGAGGMPHAQLHAIRELYPSAFMVWACRLAARRKSTGSIFPDSRQWWTSTSQPWFPEHLAWSTHDDVFFNDLLPLPYTDETLDRVVRHVDIVQNALGRQILIENPSTYVIFEQSEWEETQFMAEIARRSGCGLLFDVNNVFVSSTNNGTSPSDYIATYPLELVREIHLAGHSVDSDDYGNPLLIDAHDRAVADEVWALYAMVLKRAGALPTLIEWDNEVPLWAELEAETMRAEGFLAACPRPGSPAWAGHGQLVTS
ncbi:MAG: DUF692 domain-containing protein [Nitratireductor sp.]